MKRVFCIFSMVFLLQVNLVFCQAAYHANFLPMEDVLSSARDIEAVVRQNIKPYREPLVFSNKKIHKESTQSFSNVDIFAFIALAGVYFMLVRRKSKPRNISF